MPRPWWDPIKATKTLTIYPGPSITGSSWAAIFNNAVSEFNRLSAANALGVTYQQTSTPPEAHGPGGANVSIEAYNGTFTFEAAGSKIPVTVDGNGNEAKTYPIARDEPAQPILKEFTVVPATPQVLSANPPRVYGDGVKLCMIVHEMVHACGLFNSDHCADDVFTGYPNFITSQNPADDKLEVNGQRKLPPLFLAAKTIGLIQKNWK